MNATGCRVSATMCIVVALGAAVFAGFLFGRPHVDLSGLGVVVLLIAVVFALGSAFLFDAGGACLVSHENVDVRLNCDQVYETVSCILVDKNKYVALIKDTYGIYWACFVPRVLPPVFVVRHGEERYVPFGTDFGKAARPAESPTS